MKLDKHIKVLRLSTGRYTAVRFIHYYPHNHTNKTININSLHN